MLVLSRKQGERIHIGEDIVLTVVVLKNNQVRIGVEAPRSLDVLRGELLSSHQSEPEVSEGEPFTG